MNNLEERIKELENQVAVLEGRNAQVDARKAKDVVQEEQVREFIQHEIIAIRERNIRVEKDKAWETSWARRFLVAAVTYLVIMIFFLVIDVDHPWINAIVPTLGFLLSTLTINTIKNIWLKNRK